MRGTVRLDAEAIAQINAGAITEKGVIGLASSLHITTRHLRRIVKVKTGSSPGKLDRERRLHQAKLLLQRTKLSIVAVAFNCDFSSLRQFNDVFKSTYHLTPSQMRRQTSYTLRTETKHR